MKRMAFRLGSVLRHYERKKKQAEIDWVCELHALAVIEHEIRTLEQQLAEVIDHLRVAADKSLTAATLINCHREMERIDRARADANQRKEVQQKVVAEREKIKIKWAVSEESLETLKRNVTELNQEQAAKADQLLVDETVLRKWTIGNDDDDRIA